LSDSTLMHSTGIAVAFHNGLEDRDADEHINTGDNPSTSGWNLMSYGPVTPEIVILGWIGKNLQKRHQFH